MTWLASLAIALLTGLVSLFAGGVVAEWCVGWYRISSFEGGSGYFVVFMALLSGVAGTIVGLLIARAVAAVPGVNAFKAAGLAVATVLGVAAGVGGAARLLADVPPELDGERLYLLVELRWPAGQPPPSRDAGAGVVRLGTLSGSTLRREEDGPLFLDDARIEQRQWIAPGAVEIFTTRGTPVVNAFVEGTRIASFLPPLRRRPTRGDLEWSEWLPATSAQPGEPNGPVSYRFRISKRATPARRQHVGPFIIDTIVRDFARFGDDEAIGAISTFRLHEHDHDLLDGQRVEAVAVVSTEPWTLLVKDGEGCRLVRQGEPANQPRPALPCETERPPLLSLLALQPDQTPALATTSVPRRITGWLDKETYNWPGLYLVGPALLDTRPQFDRTGLNPVLTPHGWPPEPGHLEDVPPMALSPDQRTVVWFSPGNGYDTEPVVAARRLDTGATSTWPLDRARMRYRTPQLDMTPEWFAHHFHWERDSEGVDQLRVKADAVPLPHRGALSQAKAGEFQFYQLSPGGRRLRDAVYDILVKELHGTPLEDEPATVDTTRVEIEGVIYGVTFTSGGDEVNVTTYKTQPDAMARVAAHLDSVASSGRLDALFVADPPSP